MNNKSIKPIDRTGYLANLIYEIVEGGHEHRPAVVVGGVAWQTWALGGGAKLWWDAGTRRLMAMRPNGPLQAGEDKTFAAHIQKAGYTFKPGIKPGTSAFIDDGLNAWRGVVWVLAEAVPVGVGEDEPVPTQEGLF